MSDHRNVNSLRRDSNSFAPNFRNITIYCVALFAKPQKKEKPGEVWLISLMYTKTYVTYYINTSLLEKCLCLISS